MNTTGWLGEALGSVLDSAEDSSPVQAVEAVTRELGAALGATAVSFLIADLSGRALVRLAHITLGDSPPGDGSRDSDRRDAEEFAVVLPFDGGPAEQVLRTQTTHVLPPGAEHATWLPPGQWTVLAPVTERGDVIGLLEMSLPADPSEAVLAEIARTAHLMAFVVIASRRYTDLFEWGQRSTPFSLPAEIQRRLMPAAFTCEAGSFTLSAWLEPAANVGGDTFDFSLGRDVLHLSMTDAMSHGLISALTATLCVGSLRNTRRRDAPLLEQAGMANAALSEHVSASLDDGFVSGLLGRLDLPSGVLTLVNAGHVPPYLARADHVVRLDLPADVPFGMFAETTYRSTDLALEPGDRLVIITDGMLEGAAQSVDLAVEVGASRNLHPREATRFLSDKVLQAAGHALSDDAALMVLDWHGDHGVDRNTDAGADTGAA